MGAVRNRFVGFYVKWMECGWCLGRGQVPWHDSSVLVFGYYRRWDTVRLYGIHVRRLYFGRWNSRDSTVWHRRCKRYLYGLVAFVKVIMP